MMVTRDVELVEMVLRRLGTAGTTASEVRDLLAQFVAPAEADELVERLWRMLIFELKRVGLMSHDWARAGAVLGGATLAAAATGPAAGVRPAGQDAAGTGAPATVVVSLSIPGAGKSDATARAEDDDQGGIAPPIPSWCEGESTPVARSELDGSTCARTLFDDKSDSS